MAGNALRESLFQAAVNRYVVGQSILNQRDGDAFAQATIRYLTGQNADWNPTVTVGDHTVQISDAFRAHMANVKRWMHYAQLLLPAAAVVLLLWLCWLILSGSGVGRRRFSMGGYVTGVSLPLWMAVGIGAWALLDFNGLWGWIHRIAIPDGIFSIQDEIMQLFPVEVFSSYLQPVAITFGLCVFGLLALPAVLVWLTRRLAAKRSRPTTPGENC